MASSDGARDVQESESVVEEIVEPVETNGEEEDTDEWSMGFVDGFRVLSKRVGPSEGSAHGAVQEYERVAHVNVNLPDERTSTLVADGPEIVRFPSTTEFIASLDWCTLVLSAVASFVGWTLWVQVSQLLCCFGPNGTLLNLTLLQDAFSW